MIDAETDDALKGYAAQNNDSNVLYGYMPYDQKWLPDLLCASPLDIRRGESIAGSQGMVVLESHGPYGSLELWLDPGASYAPRRLRNKKQGADLIGDQAIGSLPIPEPGQADEMPNKALRGLIFEVEFIPSSMGGIPMIAGYTRNDTLVYEGGERYQIRREVTLSEVSFDPAVWALERTLEIPEGTSITIENAPGIKAIWQGGQIVREYDRSVIDRLSDVTFANDRSTWWRHPLLIANAILLPLILVTWWWRSWRRKSGFGE